MGEKEKTQWSKHVGALTDPGIATLAEVLDPAALSKHLRGVSLGSWDGEAVVEIQTRVLRHHERLRCTMEIGLRTDHGWHFLIGKVYHRDRFDVFQAMEKIQEAGFGPHEEFSIPSRSLTCPRCGSSCKKKLKGRWRRRFSGRGAEQSRVAAGEAVRFGGWPVFTPLR